MSGSTSSPGSDTGLFHSLRRLATTALAAVESRLRLLGTDIEIEGLRLAKLLIWVAISLFLVFLGVVLLAILVMTLAGEEHRVLALATLSGLCLGGALAIGLGLRMWMSSRPKPFQATLAELAKDRERMTS
ncbi:MAG: phage holin family protein [Gemmatimonadetes bacterium]|jgi:uncharacterized membrane protein YqjE|nr:phage holin family protein [Gemmatimonadota bacterium]MCZ6825581.1 phage holin family protein [Gemmatimonadota bacterium]